MYDSHYADTTLLLLCEQRNGSPTVFDSSLLHTPVTAVGSAHITKDAHRFGHSSCTFNGTTSYLKVGYSELFGSGDFTVSGYFYSHNTSGTLFSAKTLGDFREFTIGFNQKLYFDCNSISYRVIGGKSITIDTWHHFAYVVQDNIVSAYLDGERQWSNSFVNFNDSVVAAIGFNYLQFNSFFSGFIDEFRVTKGALYTTNFITPGSAYDGSLPAPYVGIGSEPFLVVEEESRSGGSSFRSGYTGLSESSGFKLSGYFLRQTISFWYILLI